MIKRFLLLFVCLVAPAILFGQSYPEPGSAGEPSILCTGCPGSNASGQANDGLPLYPYDVPLVRHVGRYVDSSTTPNVHHMGLRTVRAETIRIRPARDRAYIRLGSAVGAYTLSTLFNTKLARSPGLVSEIGTKSRYSRYGAPLEKVAKPDGYFDAESSSGWQTASYDTQVVLGDFDTDDRGYLYAGTLVFGWGVHLDDGRTDGTQLPFVAQYQPPTQIDKLVTLRHGDLYSLVISRSNSVSTWNVTTPSAAVEGPSRSGSTSVFYDWSKYEAGARVAVLNGDRHVRVYTNEGFVAGSAPLIDFAPPTGAVFRDLAFDDDGALWVTGTGGIWKLTPAGSGYTSTQYAFAAPFFIGYYIHASAGYLAIAGRGEEASSTVRTDDVRLFTVTGGAPQPLDTGHYFRRHYYRAPAGYSQPAGNTLYVGNSDVQLLAHGGLTYLFYSAYGFGDVYEVGAVLRPPQLKVNSISPASGPPAGGTSVTIKGRNFAQGAAVTFGGTSAATTTFIDSFTLTAVAPKGTAGASVAVNVTSGGQPAASPTSFTYVLAAPSNVVATATSTTTIQVTWGSVPTATQYEIARRNPDGTLTPLGTSATTTFIHGGRTPNTAYVYCVLTIDADGNKSAASLPDMTTTVQFTDTTIAAGMRIKAAHVIELRQAANAMRAAAGQSATTFTDTISAGVAVKRTHIEELRESIAGARAPFGIGQPVFTDYYLAALPVRAIHVQELLNAVR